MKEKYMEEKMEGRRMKKKIGKREEKITNM